MSGLVLQVATWNCWISYKKVHTGLFVLHLLFLLNWTLSSLLKCCSLLLSLFYRHCFVRHSSELTKLIPLYYSWGKSTRYFHIFHEIFVTIRASGKDVYVNSLFPGTPRLWHSLLIEWFCLTYDLNGFKFRINRHLLIIWFS